MKMSGQTQVNRTNTKTKVTKPATPPLGSGATVAAKSKVTKPLGNKSLHSVTKTIYRYF